MEYKVRYEDNTGGNDSVEKYASEEEAEAAILEELEEVKEYFRGREYHFGDFATDEGLATEIWACGDDEYASWTRLWTVFDMEEIK